MHLTPAETASLEALEQLLNYHFTNQALAVSTLTLPSTCSHPYENRLQQDFQQMEFLGDRIYNLCAATFLTAQGKSRVCVMDSLLSARTANKRQAIVARHMGLHKLLVRQGLPVDENQQHRPKLLADVLEALTAAVFIDSGCDFPLVYNIYLSHMESAPW